MLATKRAVKSSRVFLSTLFLFNLKNNNPLISTIPPLSPSLYCYFYYDYSTAAAAAAAAARGGGTRDRITSAKDIAKSFKEWFKKGHSELLNRIFVTIHKHGEDKEALGLALSQLRLPLNESFVLDVLAYGKNRNEIYSCVKFFDWAGHKGGFFHTRVTFHSIFKILTESKGKSVMLDFLEVCKGTGDLYVHHNMRFQTVLVMGYAVAGKPDVALQMLGRMRFQGLDLDTFSYHVLLNSLIEGNFLESFEVIFKQISLRGFEGAVTRVLKIKYFCKQKLLDEAEAYFRGLVNEGKVEKCRRGELFGYAHALSVLVDGFCQNGLFVKAGELIEEISKLELVPMEPAYGIWLKNLVHAGEIDAASKFMKSKKSLEGYVPDIFWCNFLLFRLLKDNRLEDVCDLLIEMKENQISANTVTMNAALCFFCKVGMVEVAHKLYKSKLEFGFSPNSMAYNYLINSLCGVGSSSEAYTLLKNSIKQGYFPGTRAFSILADALCRQGKLDMVMELVLLALSKNFRLNDSTYERLISALCRAMRFDDGYVIYEEFNRRNRIATIATYRQLIHGFSKSNRGHIASRLLIEMQDQGHQPTRKMFRAVIRCLCDMENPEMHFFKLLEMQLYRHKFNSKVCNFFIDEAGRSKKPELAREVFEMMQRNGIEATDQFIFENKLGEGGFGPVYKGVLPGGQEIAVKKLSKSSKQGFDEFKNEVMLTAKLQHVNLVKVLGFCIDREEKMLIYEYMPNKSLDYYLFDPIRRYLLDWKKREEIIEGITQGLVYLQEYSRLTIIHRDLKASNILLDGDMKAKISDFGMARIFTKDEHEANTGRLVGTYGYVPPEYVRRGQYSTKSDVYSFGIILLHIISGKKNGSLYGSNESLSLLEYAYELWKDDRGMEIMDPSLDDTFSSCKLIKCLQIAMLCVQENPADRPSMLEVSSMLRNETAIVAIPQRPAFSVKTDEDDKNREDRLHSEICSVDGATISQVVGR